MAVKQASLICQLFHVYGVLNFQFTPALTYAQMVLRVRSSYLNLPIVFIADALKNGRRVCILKVSYMIIRLLPVFPGGGGGE